MTITSFTLWFLALATFVVSGIAQTVDPTSCASGVHLLLLRGEGTGDDLNVLDSIQSVVLEQIPGSTSLGLPYQHGDSDKQFAAYNGSLLLQQYIAEYASSCPSSKIAILGYSLVWFILSHTESYFKLILMIEQYRELSQQWMQFVA